MDVSIEQLEALGPQLKEWFPCLQCLYLFGSRAKGRESASSDIDLAAFIGPGKGCNDPLLGVDMACSCERELGKPVDMVLMNRVNPVLQHEILATGVRLYEADHEFRAKAEARSFRDYVDSVYFLNRRKPA
jgi:predicted nucleotidyltransferase